MSKYLVTTTDGITIHIAGVLGYGPVIETVTPDDLLRLKRVADREAAQERAKAAEAEPAAATPEPGDLDVEAELEKFAEIYKDALRGGLVALGPSFRAAFATYLRDLESRRKPAEPSGWPEMTEADGKAISDAAIKLWGGSPDGMATWAGVIRQALQEWLDSKPRPKPAVNSNGTPVADVNSWGPVAAGTPEAVELTEEQAYGLVHAINDCLAGHEGKAAAEYVRELGYRLVRLDPKPSAEPDPGEGDDGNPDMIEALFVEFGMFQASLKTVQSYVSAIDRKLDTDGRRLDDLQKHVGSLDAHVLETKHSVGTVGKRLDSIAETVAVVPIMDRKLDAIAERLDGPKVEEEVLTAKQVDLVYDVALEALSECDAGKILSGGLANLGLMIIRKPLAKGDPS